MDNNAFTLGESGYDLRDLKMCDCNQMTEVQYRQYLDEKFKPKFSEFESKGGMPCLEVLKLFHFKDYGIPKDKRDELLITMDKNKNGKISYAEFKAYLVNKRYADLGGLNKFGICAVLAANPGMRLHAAKETLRKNLVKDESNGGIQDFKKLNTVPTSRYGQADPLSGGYSLPNGKFMLESDGVWPTSREPVGYSPGDFWDSKGPVVTIKNEKYIPKSYIEAYNCKPPPLFIPVVVIVQIAMFIYYAVEINKRATYEPWNTITWTTGFPYFSDLHYDPTRRKEVWRFVTYMFVHSGIEHILVNVTLTLLLGILIEWVNKFWRVAPVYLAGVFLGCLASSVLDPNAILVGSSAGVYALLGAHLALVVINWEEMQHDWTNLRASPLACLSSGVVRLIIIFLLIAIDLGFALYRRFGVNDELKISFVGHVFGFAAGLLVGIPLLKNIREKPWERIFFWICLVLYFILVVIGIFFNLLWPNFPAQTV